MMDDETRTGCGHESGSPVEARAKYVPPTLTRATLAGVIAGGGGSQHDSDFSISRPGQG